MTPKKKKLNIIQKIQRYWRETVGELRKVTWPTPTEAWKMTRPCLVGHGSNVTHPGAPGLGLLEVDQFARCVIAMY